MIVEETLSNIDSIINDMKIQHQKIRSMFKFSMSQVAKNSNDLIFYPSQNILKNQLPYPSKTNSISLNPNKFYAEEDKDQLFSKLYLNQQIQSENKSKSIGSTLQASQNIEKKKEEFGQRNQSPFPDTLMEIQQQSDQIEVNYLSGQHNSFEQKKSNKVLKDFKSSESNWFITNRRENTNKGHLKSQYSPDQKINEFEHQ